INGKAGWPTNLTQSCCCRLPNAIRSSLLQQLDELRNSWRGTRAHVTKDCHDFQTNGCFGYSVQKLVLERRNERVSTSWRSAGPLLFFIMFQGMNCLPPRPVIAIVQCVNMVMDVDSVEHVLPRLTEWAAHTGEPRTWKRRAGEELDGGK